MRHIFIYVVRSNQDPFAGIRRALDRDGDTSSDIRFNEDELDLIDSVEYTARRPFRFWHYRGIFRGFEERLDATLAEAQGPVTVYMADEGVWAVLWANYRRRLSRTGIRAVNVQHGFALLEPAPHKRLRRWINAAAVIATGYPAIGYGSAGGAGPEPFDAYLTYDQGTADFAMEQSGRPALAAPRLIKHELISRFNAARSGPAGKRTLFTMNIAIPGSPVVFCSQQTYDELLPLAESLVTEGFELVIRLHPGMNRAEEVQIFERHPIARHATLDAEPSLYAAMATAMMVMSYLSTSLWEGGLLGLLPVQVLGAGCRPVELGYPRERLDLAGDIDRQVMEICRKARSPDAFDWESAEAQEWTRVNPLLWGEGN